uniref:SpoU_methylase domain-containing protein n=1 Tax=Loa loa TaxID=7209 RepID=A0A1I7VIX6_LOALO
MSIYSKDDWLSTKGLLFLCFHSRYQRQYSLKADISSDSNMWAWLVLGSETRGIPDVADNFCNFALVKVLKR